MPGQETEVQTYSVAEAGKRLGLCRNAAYEAVKAGQIPHLTFGRRIVVPKAAFDRMLTTAKQDPKGAA